MVKKIGLIMALSVVLLTSPVARAAEPLNDTQIELIRQYCSSSQLQLKRVFDADSVTRLSWGREYEATIELLTAMNSRVALNALSVPALTDATTAYQREFAAFKKAFLEYGDASKRARGVDCSEQPVTYYDMVVTVREARGKMTQHIESSRQILGVYDRGLDELSKQIDSPSEAQNAAN